MNKVRKMRRRQGVDVPDEVYLVLETAVDDVMNVIEAEKEGRIRSNIFHTIGKEFQFMLRDKMQEVIRNKENEG